MNLILVGPPGSGKGTQAKKISQIYNIPHISTGDMFRYNLSKLTPVGIEAKKYLDEGLLVPDFITNEMVELRLQMDDTKNGFLLDGFPRNIAQAEFLDSILKKNNKQIDLVLFVNVLDEVIVDRITGRRVCPVCGHINHISNMTDNICPFCKAAYIQRADDTKEVVINRLKVYHEQTEPIVEYYSKKNVLQEIDGDQKAHLVEDQIISCLGKLNG